MAQLKTGTTIGGRNIVQELDAHLADYAQHGVTMGHENDIYVAKIGPLFRYTSLEMDYNGIIML